MTAETTWTKPEVAEAMAILNRIVMGLFLRTQYPVADRDAQVGRLWVVEDAASVETVFDNPQTFQKNFGLVATLGASRFNLNGERWLALRGKTQRRYARAGRPAMRQVIAGIYRAEIEALAAPSIAELETALARAALRVFFLAFDLTPDVTPFLQHFARLRVAAAMLQYRSWLSLGETGAARANTLARAHELTEEFWQTCREVPEVAALITTLAAEPPEVGIDVAVSDFMTNMFAGIETTTASLGWMIDSLGRSAEVQPKVRQDAAEAAGTDRTDGADGYLGAFRDECLRFFPPIPFVVRELAEDVVLNARPLHQGEQVLISIVGLHRDPGVWTDPNGFHAARPEFLESQGAAPPAFRPFLSGPRVCGGRRIAELELTEALKILVERFEFRAPKADTAFQYSLAFRPKLAADFGVSRR